MKQIGNLFGMNFEKEGPGAPENGKKDPVFIRFFKIIKRKFWAMLRINAMQLIGSLPALAIAVLLISPMYMDFLPDHIGADFGARLLVGFLFLSLQLICVGPVQAGFIYTMRNYAREEHVFVWHDFIKGIRENWKRAGIVSLIDLLMVYLVSYTWCFYRMLGAKMGMIEQLCSVILLIILVIYAMMHMYIYPMMATLDLNVRQLYANAFRFAIGKFLPNLGILALIILFDCLIFLNQVTGVLLMALVGFVFPNFLSTYYAYLGIDKHIIQKIRRMEAGENRDM